MRAAGAFCSLRRTSRTARLDGAAVGGGDARRRIARVELASRVAGPTVAGKTPNSRTHPADHRRAPCGCSGGLGRRGLWGETLGGERRSEGSPAMERPGAPGPAVLLAARQGVQAPLLFSEQPCLARCCSLGRRGQPRRPNGAETGCKTFRVRLGRGATAAPRPRRPQAFVWGEYHVYMDLFPTATFDHGLATTSTPSFEAFAAKRRRK